MPPLLFYNIIAVILSGVAAKDLQRTAHPELAN